MSGFKFLHLLYLSAENFCSRIVSVTSLGIDKMICKNTVKSGWGAMSLFVGLRGTAEELGLKAQNIWAFTGCVFLLSAS